MMIYNRSLWQFSAFLQHSKEGISQQLGMDQQFKLFLKLISKTKGVLFIQSTLPLEETSLAHLQWGENWKAQLQKYLRNALTRCDSNSKRNGVNMLLERVNFELARTGDKKIKL